MVTYQLLNVMQHLKLEKNSKNLPSFCLGLFSENMNYSNEGSIELFRIIE